MTTPQADGADRISRVAKTPLSASAAFSGIAILLLVGLLLRLTIAYVLLPGSGFESDIGTFTAWARDLAERGPGSFYATAGFADYPPGYLYVLLLIGELGDVLAPLAGGDAVRATAALVKIPAILADIAVGYVLYRVVRSWRAPRLDAHRLGLIAAAIYVFNPVTWYDSAIWGQTDAFGALVVLLTVAALVRGNSEGATALAVLGLLIKPQFGIVLLPLVGIVLLRRHAVKPGSSPRNPVLLPSAARSWFERESGFWRLISSAVVGLVVLLALITPFSLDVPGFIREMAETAGGYPYLSVNGYNPWALIGSDGNDGIAFGGAWSWNPDSVPLVGPVPGLAIGTLLLGTGFLIGIARAGWRADRSSIIVVGLFLALAFFMLPTRVHERYMFPIFGLLPLLAVVDRRWLWATVVLSIAAFINLHGVLTTPLYASPNVEGLPFGDLFRQTPGVLASVILHIGGFAFIAWQMRPNAISEPDPYEGPDTVAAADEAPTEADTGLYPVPARASWADGARAAIGRFVGLGSVRRDRSVLLVGETGGPLDRKDLALIALVFISTLLLRTYRLEVPYSMHFDEVYHARTATEFLQHWEYGEPHDIYEYTHPHLAKYLMAVGIMTLGNNRVVGEQPLNTPVTAAAVEQRWSPDEFPNLRNGDRLYVATPAEVRVYDLATRAQVATIPGSFSTLTLDAGIHTLFVADAAGEISSVDTTLFDDARATNTTGAVVDAQPLAQLVGGLVSITAAADRVIAITGDGSLVAIDSVTGAETGRTSFPDPAAVVELPSRDQVVVDPALVEDPIDMADTLAGLTDRDTFAIQDDIERATKPIPIAGFLDDAVITDITDEELTGVTIERSNAVGVALSTGFVLLDADSLNELAFFGTPSPGVSHMALAGGGPDQPTLYGVSQNTVVTLELASEDEPRLGRAIEMPGDVQRVVWNDATTMVHVLGRTPDGAAPTIYVIEPRSNSVFADARLAADPVALLMDAQPDYPAEDRNDILAVGGDGAMATVDAGNNQFAYRFPGVLLASLMAVCIYLLGRFLFRRRSIAIIASLLVLADGMFFANARIAMNDAYVSFFIVAAFTLFVAVWLGRWRRGWQIALGLLGIGVLLGFALSSKWVGAYAIGGLGLLVLLRSALGRVIALVAMIGMTAYLGYVAITPNPAVESPQLNFPFLAMMLGLTALLAVAMTVRPMRLTRDEVRFAVVAPVGGGAALLAAGVVSPGRLLLAGAVLIAVGAGVAVAAWLAGRYGYGPYARLDRLNPEREPAALPPERGWLRPGSGLLGLPWLLALSAILLIPVAIYIVHYYPWIELGNQWVAGVPAGNTGQKLFDLQLSMYDYHNELRATHPASSPWWAWPFDLKPVWFEQNDYAGATTAVIYDTGNLVIFWLAIPAVIWVAYMTWKRRSLPLTFVVIAIAVLWLPWARIDRATFQYHIFTTLPFSFLALAYFLGELWHGPSRRTWALARATAALAVIGAPILWLLRLPLCGIARTESVNSGTEVCAQLTREMALTDLQLIGLVMAVGGLIAAGALFFGMRDSLSSRNRALMLPISFSAALLGVVIVLIGAGLDGRAVFTMDVQAEWPALGALLLLAVPAYFVLRATDPRRFVLGALGAAAVWFVTFYPNIASLPVPTALSQIHLGLLPTWNWGFQFGVNRDIANEGPVDVSAVGLLAVAAMVLCVAGIYAARAWRSGGGPDEDPVVSPLPEAG